MEAAQPRVGGSGQPTPRPGRTASQLVGTSRVRSVDGGGIQEGRDTVELLDPGCGGLTRYVRPGEEHARPVQLGVELVPPKVQGVARATQSEVVVAAIKVWE